MKTYDVIVVGGGPGGYVAAIRAAQYGRRVALVEGDHLGGACLNRGCIPSKTLLRFAETLELIEQAKSWGIDTGEVALDFSKMTARKNKVIQQLRGGVAMLMKRGGIEVHRGFGTVHPDKTVTVRTSNGQEEQLRAESVILATGSAPVLPPIEGLAESGVHSSDTIFELESIPESIAIVGGGYIGVEFACMFSALGARVTVVEAAATILPNEDPDAAAALAKALIHNGVTLFTGTKVQSFRRVAGGRLEVAVQGEKGETRVLNVSEAVAAVGRKPNTKGLEMLDLKRNGPFVAVNERQETNLAGIYAVGDLAGGWQLAHMASAEGTVAAANASGRALTLDQRAVPRCIYTHPEIASVGLGEAEALKLGKKVKTVAYPLPSTGKGMAMDARSGFIKLIAEETHGEIIGVVMVGPHVTEMISEASAYIHLEGTVEELASMIHPHPTLSEGLGEAAAAWLGDPLHS